MKRILLYILSLICIIPALAQTPKEVVQRFLDKVDRQTLVTSFAVSVTDNASQPVNYNGSAKMRGDRFVLSMFQTEAAYDGKTLYLYSEDTDELTLTNPTPEELLSANPILFAKALLMQSTIRYSAANSRDDEYLIEFVPDHKDAGIQKFVLRLRASDYMPLEIQVKEGTQLTRLTFSKSSFSSSLPAFTLQKDGAYVNDLR